MRCCFFVAAIFTKCTEKTPLQAQKQYQARRCSRCNAKRINEADWQAVADYIRLDLSPQQAICRLSLERNEKIGISHTSVYARIHAQKRRGDKRLSVHLRHAKPYKKRYQPGLSRRGQIKNKVSIDDRPDIVADKSRLGDWEGDTMIGKAQRGILVTLVERKSRYVLAAPLPTKHAPGVADCIARLLTPHQAKCHTITFDNGLEFARHEHISLPLKTDVYFAHPYRSWERGANENVNGLIRQYFPKNTEFRNITQQTVNVLINRLNHRPRKCLNYKTPHEVFFNKDILPLKIYDRCTS